MIDIEQLRAEFTTVQTEATALIEKAAGENRDLTAEEREANDKRFARLETINTLIADFNKALSLKFANGNAPAQPKAKEEADRGAKFDPKDFGKHASEWALNGQVTNAEFATITTATSSGIILPKSVGAPVLSASVNPFRAAHAFYGIQPVTTTDTADLTLPVLNMGAGSQVDEDQSSGTENAPAVASSLALKAKLFQSGQAWFSNTQLSSLSYNLFDFLLAEVTNAKELALEAYVVAKIIADAGITQEVELDDIGTWTYAKLVSARRKGPSRYDTRKLIVLSSDAFAAAESLTDEQGRPVLVADPQNQELMKFNGVPVYKSDAFATGGTDHWGTADRVVGVVISLAGARLRDCEPARMTRYVNQPGKPDQTGFELFANGDFGYVPTAVTKIVNPVS